MEEYRKSYINLGKYYYILLNLQSQIKILEKENKNYKINNNIMKKTLLYKKDIENLLKIEKIKTEIWKNLLIKNTNIKVDNIIENLDNINYDSKIDIEDYINDIQISKIIYEKSINIFSNNTHNDTENNQIVENDKKKSYRTIKNCIKLSEELDRKDIINKIDENIKLKLEKLPDISSVKLEIDSLLNKLKDSRIYIKILTTIKNKRLSLLGKLSYEDYKILLLKYNEIIINILKTKNYNSKKIKNIISKSLSSLESRIIRYDNYINSHLEIDEIEMLLESIKLHINFPKKFIQYNNKWLCEKLYNYSIVVYPIEKIIKYFLFNYYSFYNVVYLPLPKSSKIDPYSFYTLERVNKEKRYWKMDCRLEELSNNISIDTLSYMIDIFRKIYYDVFGDNIFRSDYCSRTQITECDCEQLIENIFLLSQPIKFCNKIRFLVIENSTYIPTENDKFNLYGDDTLQKKKFQNRHKTDNILDIIKQIFDGITTEDAVDFYRSRNSLV